MPKTRRRARPIRGITRIDQDSTRTHGFFVRTGWRRRRDGVYAPRFTAFFGDVTHGGKRRALKAAVAWLAKTAPAVKKGKTKKGKTRKKKRSAA